MQVEWFPFHNLNEENIKRYVTTDSGIYLLWVKLKNNKWRCCYVGKAENLERRLLEHLSYNENNECIKSKIQYYTSGYEYAKVSKQSDRDGIEKFLYDCYKPECNEIDPGDYPIPVNLP